MESSLVDLSAAGKSGPRDGATKRRARDALPRVCLVFEEGSSCISGAILLTRCFHSNGVLYWTVASLVLLSHECSISGKLSWRCGLAGLSRELETRIRESETSVGGSLNSHFLCL